MSTGANLSFGHSRSDEKFVALEDRVHKLTVLIESMVDGGGHKARASSSPRREPDPVIHEELRSLDQRVCRMEQLLRDVEAKVNRASAKMEELADNIAVDARATEMLRMSYQETEKRHSQILEQLIRNIESLQRSESARDEHLRSGLAEALEVGNRFESYLETSNATRERQVSEAQMTIASMKQNILHSVAENMHGFRQSVSHELHQMLLQTDALTGRWEGDRLAAEEAGRVCVSSCHELASTLATVRRAVETVNERVTSVDDRQQSLTADVKAVHRRLGSTLRHLAVQSNIALHVPEAHEHDAPVPPRGSARTTTRSGQHAAPTAASVGGADSSRVTYHDVLKDLEGLVDRCDDPGRWS